MMIDVQHLQKRGNSWRYRRKVPKALREAIGKGEIVEPLGSSEAEALRKYQKVHARVERQLALAAAPKRPAPLSTEMTQLERYRWATKHVAALGLGDDAEREIVAEQIAARYPSDEDHGDPLGVSDTDVALIRELMLGSRQERPKPTLEDAKRLYLKEKVRGNGKKSLELERVFRMLSEAIDLKRPLESLRREDAKEAKEYMFDGKRTASTVDRYLNVVRAVINHAIAEYDLACKNPFMGLEVEHRDKAEPDRRKRRPYTQDEIERVRVRLRDRAAPALLHIWRILEGTGCRLAEVAGLRVVDVHLEHRIPYIDVEWHEDRRVKTKSSWRSIPLMGDALEAAKEAVKAAKGQDKLFPLYCREGGPGAASAALSKHVRAVVKDRKIGPAHSLRHGMSDMLDLTDTSDSVKDRLLGHTKGEARETYGGALEAWLEIAKRALEKAMGY